VLRRADGIELIGEYEDSGFKEPPLLARRADGQVVQLTELLYTVAESADGRRDLHEIAEIVSERSGRQVSADNVSYLADRQLRPLGVLALADGTTPELEKREPLMALRHRRPLLSERVVNAVARPFVWLHRPVVTLVVLVALAAFDAWLFGVHGIAAGMRSAIYNPALLLAVLGSTVVATAFHEFGHASACRYGGARPGVMGVGLYLVWPAFYCDVTDAYRLNRRGRLRTDLGGVYFNAIFALFAGGVYFYTGEEAALLAAFLQHVIMLQQLLPLLRFDGYYVMSDLTGVPDILSRIKPIFRSLVRGRKREPKVAELKPWVRVVVTAYLVLLLPTLAFLFAWMVMAAPRLLATVYDSFGLQIDRIVASAGFAEAGVGVVRLLALVMPVAAMTLSISRMVRMTGRGLIRWSSDSVPRRIVAATGAAALIGSVGYILWPNGDYQPIRPGEKGTIGEAIQAVGDAPGGRPFYTPEHELIYQSVPTEREAEAAEREGRPLEGAADPSAAPPGTGLPGDGMPAPAPGDQAWGLGDDGMPWSGDSDSGSGGSGGTDSWSPTSPSGTTTQPGTSTTQPGTTTTQPGTTTTSPPSSGSTTTSPPPSDSTTTTPPPSDGGSTTTEPAPAPSEPTPDSTTTSPDSTAPAPDSTTESAPVSPGSLAEPAPETTVPDATTPIP